MFDVTLFMCVFHVMLDEMVTPRYFAVSTDSRVSFAGLTCYVLVCPST